MILKKSKLIHKYVFFLNILDVEKSYRSPYAKSHIWKSLHPIVGNNLPIIILENFSPYTIVQAGLMDGTILIIPMNKLDNQKEMIISKSSVTALATNKNNLLVIAGTYSGGKGEI